MKLSDIELKTDGFVALSPISQTPIEDVRITLKPLSKFSPEFKKYSDMASTATAEQFSSVEFQAELFVEWIDEFIVPGYEKTKESLIAMAHSPVHDFLYEQIALFLMQSFGEFQKFSENAKGSKKKA